MKTPRKMARFTAKDVAGRALAAVDFLSPRTVSRRFWHGLLVIGPSGLEHSRDIPADSDADARSCGTCLGGGRGSGCVHT